MRHSSCFAPLHWADITLHGIRPAPDAVARVADSQLSALWVPLGDRASRGAGVDRECPPHLIISRHPPESLPFLFRFQLFLRHESGRLRQALGGWQGRANIDTLVCLQSGRNEACVFGIGESATTKATVHLTSGDERKRTAKLIQEHLHSELRALRTLIEEANARDQFLARIDASTVEMEAVPGTLAIWETYIQDTVLSFRADTATGQFVPTDPELFHKQAQHYGLRVPGRVLYGQNSDGGYLRFNLKSAPDLQREAPPGVHAAFERDPGPVADPSRVLLRFPDYGALREALELCRDEPEIERRPTPGPNLNVARPDLRRIVERLVKAGLVSYNVDDVYRSKQLRTS